MVQAIWSKRRKGNPHRDDAILCNWRGGMSLSDQLIVAVTSSLQDGMVLNSQQDGMAQCGQRNRTAENSWKNKVVVCDYRSDYMLGGRRRWFNAVPVTAQH